MFVFLVILFFWVNFILVREYLFDWFVVDVVRYEVGVVVFGVVFNKFD